MDFHRTLESIIMTASPREKRERFDRFYDAWKAGRVKREEVFEPKSFESPSYAAFCQVVSPQAVPKRKSPSTKEGQVLLLHAIAHIEYSAIDLALDHAYRFPGLPKAYYDDWLEVADDEFRHFGMIERLLKSRGAAYGDFPVHDALFEAAQRTPTLLERMAVVPRYFEANGLDATPQILEKLRHFKSDPVIGEMIALLNVILEEEVDHVRKGDRWFAWACEREKADRSVYFEIIDRFYPGSYPRQKFLNVEARLRAGFSCGELNRMGKEKVC